MFPRKMFLYVFVYFYPIGGKSWSLSMISLLRAINFGLDIRIEYMYIDWLYDIDEKIIDVYDYQNIC